MNHVRQSKIERSRVGHITKGYKSGGAVKHSDEKQDRKLVKSMIDKAIHPEGHKAKHRMDRPKRAKRADGGPVKPGTPESQLAEAQRRHDEATKSGRSSTLTGQLYGVQREGRAKGGRVKKGNAKTIVNVITGGHPAGGAVPPGPPPPPMGIAGPPPGGMAPPPMAAKPPMPPMGPGAGGPPGGPPMPLRAKGGRVQTPTGSGVSPINNSSRKTNGSPVYNASTRNGTQVSDGDGNNKDDSKDVGRGTPITFKSGGRVRSFYAKGGKVEAPQGVSAASKLPGGSGGGKGRLAKEHRAERDYARPAR